MYHIAIVKILYENLHMSLSIPLCTSSLQILFPGKLSFKEWRGRIAFEHCHRDCMMIPPFPHQHLDIYSAFSGKHRANIANDTLVFSDISIILLLQNTGRTCAHCTHTQSISAQHVTKTPDGATGLPLCHLKSRLLVLGCPVSEGSTCPGHPAGPTALSQVLPAKPN